jgi:hypothetical protein
MTRENSWERSLMMKNEKQFIHTAWRLSNLMSKLNDMIWDQFEFEFIERFINKTPTPENDEKQIRTDLK